MAARRRVYTNAVVPPAASPRPRTSVLAIHTADQLGRAVAAFARLPGRTLPGRAITAPDT